MEWNFGEKSQDILQKKVHFDASNETHFRLKSTAIMNIFVWVETPIKKVLFWAYCCRQLFNSLDIFPWA